MNRVSEDSNPSPTAVLMPGDGLVVMKRGACKGWEMLHLVCMMYTPVQSAGGTRINSSQRC